MPDFIAFVQASELSLTWSYKQSALRKSRLLFAFTLPRDDRRVAARPPDRSRTRCPTMRMPIWPGINTNAAPKTQHHAFFERYGLIAASATSALRDPNEARSLPARRTPLERRSDSAKARSSAIGHHAHMDELPLRRNESQRLRRSVAAEGDSRIAEAQFSTATSSHMIEAPPTGIDPR